MENHPFDSNQIGKVLRIELVLGRPLPIRKRAMNAPQHSTPPPFSHELMLPCAGIRTVSSAL